MNGEIESLEIYREIIDTERREKRTTERKRCNRKRKSE